MPLAFGLRVFAELCHEARELLVSLRELLTAVLRELDSLLHEARELVYIGAFALDAADDLVETACSFLIGQVFFSSYVYVLVPRDGGGGYVRLRHPEWHTLALAGGVLLATGVDAEEDEEQEREAPQRGAPVAEEG